MSVNANLYNSAHCLKKLRANSNAILALCSLAIYRSPSFTTPGSTVTSAQALAFTNPLFKIMNIPLQNSWQAAEALMARILPSVNIRVRGPLEPPASARPGIQPLAIWEPARVMGQLAFICTIIKQWRPQYASQTNLGFDYVRKVIGIYHSPDWQIFLGPTNRSILQLGLEFMAQPVDPARQPNMQTVTGIERRLAGFRRKMQSTSQAVLQDPRYAGAPAPGGRNSGNPLADLPSAYLNPVEAFEGYEYLCQDAVKILSLLARAEANFWERKYTTNGGASLRGGSVEWVGGSESLQAPETKRWRKAFEALRSDSDAQIIAKYEERVASGDERAAGRRQARSTNAAIARRSPSPIRRNGSPARGEMFGFLGRLGF